MNPLHDMDGEKTVLGAVLVHPRVLADVHDLRSEHFHHPAHAAMWEAIRELDGDQEPIDEITVLERMQVAKKADLLNGIGGRAYFDEVRSSILTVENIGYHAHRLRSIFRRRRWHAWLRKLAVQAADESVETEEFLDQVERGAIDLASQDQSSAGPRHISVIAHEVWQEIEKRGANPEANGVTGIATGCDGYDQMTGGHHAGELVILGGRPKMGKSAMMLNWLAWAAQKGEPCLLFPLEMRDRANVERLLSSHGAISSTSLRHGKLNKDEWIAFSTASSRVGQWNVFVDDRSGPTLSEIRTTARAWRARWPKANEKKIGTVFIDYLQLINGERGSRMDRRAEIELISRGLKNLARELECTVVALSQLNRKLEERTDKRPMMSDLRESGSLEQDADVIAFVYRDVVYNRKTEDPDAAELIIAAQRNGPSGTDDLRWDAKTQTFKNGEAPMKSTPTVRPPKGNWHPYAPNEDD